MHLLVRVRRSKRVLPCLCHTQAKYNPSSCAQVALQQVVVPQTHSLSDSSRDEEDLSQQLADTTHSSLYAHLIAHFELWLVERHVQALQSNASSQELDACVLMVQVC